MLQSYKLIVTNKTVTLYCLITDVDECLTNNGGCDQLCDNTVGSYVCSCEDGYRLLRDDHECEGRTYVT